MKRTILSLLAILPFFAIAQIPTGYYSSAAGLSGKPLRVALKNIIRPHTILTYTPGLWNAYYTTDVKPNGKLWDMYSDIPGGTPAYEYTIVSDQCGSTSPSAEGGCYNREHTWPQSKFSYDTAIKCDLQFVIPTDNYVNAQRDDFPYGEVGGTPAHIFTNNSKLGTNGYAGSPSSTCFEPVDSFKGDIARLLFYVATCYYGADSTKFTNWEMATGISFKPWAIAMLLEWHHNDPVSAKEINRNNKAYLRQNNRNPFIDYPG
ncbi:MAG: endonuclease, partial [Taibaiella sp.]|nr:endonuclease [Taibaiella sp.]